MRTKDALGRYGEQLAADHLAEAGLVILARNWRCRDGELDIVARDSDTLVFCEVKTRSSVRFGTPAEAVTAVKAARIRRLALHWLAETRQREGAEYWPALRFDLISVLRQFDAPPRIDHFRGAF